MILKIEDGCHKLFFDGVTQVSAQPINVTSRKDLEELAMKADYNNLCPLPTEDADGKIDFTFQWIVIQPGNKVLACQGEAYLINEVNGKTIERL